MSKMESVECKQYKGVESIEISLFSLHVSLNLLAPSLQKSDKQHFIKDGTCVECIPYRRVDGVHLISNFVVTLLSGCICFNVISLFVKSIAIVCSQSTF